jgi:hypothetical protein
VLTRHSAALKIKDLGKGLKSIRNALGTAEQDLSLTKHDADVTEVEHLRRAAKQTILDIARLNREIDYHIRQHAAPACLSLCDLVQDKLPRELRDMIYGFMLEKSYVKITHKDLEPDRFDPDIIKSLETILDSPLECLRDEIIHYDNVYDYAHLFDSDFTDPVTQSEFAESWYRTVTFAIRPKHISKLLEQHRWDGSIEPRSLVKRIEITALLYLATEKYRARFLNSLEHLFQLKAGATITFWLPKIKPPQLTQESAKPAAEKMAFCFETLLRLKHAGYAVIVKSPIGLEFLVEDEVMTVDGWVQKMLEADLKERKYFDWL